MLEKAKRLEGTERLASKISGIIASSGWYIGHRKVVFEVNHDQVRDYTGFVIVYPKLFLSSPMAQIW